MKRTTAEVLASKTPASKKFMLFIPILFLLMLLSFVSCRNNDDNPSDSTAAQNLIGIWQPYKMNQKATLTSGNYDQTTDFTICQQKGRIIFNDNNIGSVTTYSEINGTCVQQDKAMFTYVYDDNSKILTITNADGTKQAGTVIQLTPTDLVYELVGNYDFQGQTNVQVKTTFYVRRTKD